MSGAVWVGAVRVPAELPLVALHADALAVLAVAVAAAVRDLALLIPETPDETLIAGEAPHSPHVALLPLPARFADALAAGVLALAAAELGADAHVARLPVIARLAPTLPRHALPVPVASLPAAPGGVPAPGHKELNRVRLAVIIVHRHEPVAGLQEEALGPTDRALKHSQQSDKEESRGMRCISLNPLLTNKGIKSQQCNSLEFHCRSF